MSSLALTERTTTSSGAYFTITMWLEASGGPFVRSCEVIGNGIRNRTSFGKQVPVSGAFSDQMAAAIECCIDRLSYETEVLILSDFLLELPGLILGGLQIIATKLESGSINLIFRFMDLIGSISSIFRNSVGLDCNVAEKVSALGAKVLGDIAAPLLNICTAMENDNLDAAESLGEFGKSIAKQSHEIRFQVELLSRFVDQQSKLAVR